MRFNKGGEMDVRVRFPKDGELDVPVRIRRIRNYSNFKVLKLTFEFEIEEFGNIRICFSKKL